MGRPLATGVRCMACSGEAYAADAGDGIPRWWGDRGDEGGSDWLEGDDQDSGWSLRVSPWLNANTASSSREKTPVLSNIFDR